MFGRRNEATRHLISRRLGQVADALLHAHVHVLHVRLDPVRHLPLVVHDRGQVLEDPAHALDVVLQSGREREMQMQRSNSM